MQLLNVCVNMKLFVATLWFMWQMKKKAVYHSLFFCCWITIIFGLRKEVRYIYAQCFVRGI